MVDTARAQRAYARLAGLMFLIVLAASVGGLVLPASIAGDGTLDERTQRIVAAEGPYRLALVLALCGSLFTGLLATALYVTVRPGDGNLAVIGLLFRAVEAIVGAVGIVIAFAGGGTRLCRSRGV